MSTEPFKPRILWDCPDENGQVWAYLKTGPYKYEKLKATVTMEREGIWSFRRVTVDEPRVSAPGWEPVELG